MQADLEDLAGLLGEEVGRAQKTEREEVGRQFELMRYALEKQANRIADLEAMIATPRRSVMALAENVTDSLIAGRAS
ncbi:hypothetical protein [Bradyrhizobium sp. 195]|uniref:hypothetical protein n=1 Tax=Bradyrhizobium sp. 195 TaxID=2782662 RepID=UPI002000F343|nr:hypothetical protein [Bradyrhizobium sp. 195]UPK30843.1 hypothetical protein IVB26_39935 [Bradyrhizobium sp. 195]